MHELLLAISLSSKVVIDPLFWIQCLIFVQFSSLPLRKSNIFESRNKTWSNCKSSHWSKLEMDYITGQRTTCSMWKSEFQDTRGAEDLNEFAWGDASGSWWRGDAKQKERNLGRPKLCPATSLHSSNLWLYFKSVPSHVHSSTAERAKATWMQSWGKELHLVDCGAEGKVSLGISTLIAIRPDIFSAHRWRNKKFQLSCIIASISYIFCTLQLIFLLPRRILHLACWAH